MASSERARHVVITGAGGFVGGACAAEFRARGWEVTAPIHRRPVRQAGLRTVQVDLADTAALSGVPRPIDALVHCAGRATDVGPRARFLRDNVELTAQVCALVRRLEVRRLVHISTTDVYGVRDCDAADEETPLEDNQRNPYAATKILAEEVVRTHLARERYCILRPAFVWGPGDTSVLPRVLAFLRGTPVIVHFGAWRGKNRWPLSYVGNVARAAYLTAWAPRAAGEAYNVVDRERMSLDAHYRDLIEIFFPGMQKKRSCTLPLWVGRAIGNASTQLSNLVRADHPLFDPSRYSLAHITHDQDFSGEKLARLFARHDLAMFDHATGRRALREWSHTA